MTTPAACDYVVLIPLTIVLLALDMSAAARDLSRNVAAAVAHGPATVSVRNLSSLGPADTAAIRRAFESEVKAADQSPVAIQVTISENPSQFVLVAEILRNGERQVLLESWPRLPSGAATRDSGSSVTLEKKLLWEQDQPILDAVHTGEATVILDATRVTLAQGDARQSVSIPSPHPWPRDLRGRLSVGDGAFTAWLPGTVCRGALQPRLSIECQELQDPWLLAPGALAAFAPNGNAFTGHLDMAPGGAHQLEPFFSAALTGDLYAFAGVDGRARIYSHSWEQIAATPDWGSDIAAIQTPCGAAILATRPGESPARDAVQPFEISGATLRATGRPLEFSGPITALWSAGNTVTAISRDLQTGRYAAYSLAPACGG